MYIVNFLDSLNQFIDQYGDAFPFKHITMDDLKKNIGILERCADFILDLFCQIGLQKNYEPNEIGLELESCLDFLNKIRFQYHEKERYKYDL